MSHGGRTGDCRGLWWAAAWRWDVARTREGRATGDGIARVGGVERGARAFGEGWGLCVVRG